MRRTLADTDQDRRGGGAVVVNFGSLPVELGLDRGEVGGRLQRRLQGVQLVFTVGLARLGETVVALDQFRRVVLQAFDAQRAETVARAGVIVGAQLGVVSFSVDARLAVE